jgi:hypothetical protein
VDSKQFKTLASSIEDQSWINSVTVNFPFKHLHYHQQFIGLTSIYEFVAQQNEGWNKIDEKLPGELEQSKNYFAKAKQELVSFFQAYVKNPQSQEGQWNNVKNHLRLGSTTNNYIFPYDAPETEFLIRVFVKSSQYYKGAYHYVVDQFQISNKEDFVGAILGYEFAFKENSEITKRRNAEKSSIGKLKHDFQDYISRAENDLLAHFSASKLELQEHLTELEKSRKSKEDSFSEWLTGTKNSFQSFDEDAKNQIEELEKTYQEKLRLKKPAEYWNTRASKLKKEGRIAIIGLAVLSIIAGGALFSLLWLPPEGVFLSFIEDPVKSVKWSIIFISFLSFFAYGIRILSKISFSAYHLARDAEEREQLTYLYLSLIENSSVDEKDRNLILQSLFSRADTGLLKDDSSPTMPGNVINRLLSHNH